MLPDCERESAGGRGYMGAWLHGGVATGSVGATESGRECCQTVNVSLLGRGRGYRECQAHGEWPLTDEGFFRGRGYRMSDQWGVAIDR